MTARGMLLLALAVSGLAVPSHAPGADSFLLLQSTTSTKNSGLLDHILPAFTESSGIKVRVVAVGSGQALKNARNGDGDVLLVHSQEDELEFVAAGWGLKRHAVMYNDFVLVGPDADPIVGGDLRIEAALRRIAETHTPFISRGDESGTHKKEMQLWRAAGLAPRETDGSWYREIGSGMGAALNTAVAMNAYILSDRGTWISFRNKRDFRILVQDKDDSLRDQDNSLLFNQYSAILVNPERHPHTRLPEGQAFIRWLTGPRGQALIADYRIQGQQLFFPNAKPDAAE